MIFSETIEKQIGAKTVTYNVYLDGEDRYEIPTHIDADKMIAVMKRDINKNTAQPYTNTKENIE